jgi:hypothetical protein
MLRHWDVLCRHIGERRAGSAGEQAAAGYCLVQFKAAGLAAVHAESFPCLSAARTEARIAFEVGRRFRSLPARVLAGSPSTPGSRPVEGELVWIEMPEQAERKFSPSLRGKIVVLVGPTPTRADLHRRLVECRPAAVIHVDDRLPFEWVKDDGVYPAWVRRFGMPPIVAVPFRLAWEFRKQGARRARVRIAVELREAFSQNVVAEVRGRRPDLPLVLLGAHHDTQCHNIGADDNASGVVALLELGARLACTKPLRTMRLVSFGAEEQLSVGSARYVRDHQTELGAIGAVLNLDSVASLLGHHWLVRAGTAPFGTWLQKQLAGQGLDTVEKPAPMPFADHFPFSVFGVPAVTFYRPNMDSGMRWQHHSIHDNLDNVSVTELARVVRAVGSVALTLANLLRWPFPRGLAPEQRAETDRLARDLYDLRGTK